MHSKTVTKIISLVVINALTALLIFQINFAGGKSSPTLAQTTGNYSATWTISECRRLRSNFTDGDHKVDIILGVAKWNVSYSIDGTPDAIKEIWTVPDDKWIDISPVGSRPIVKIVNTGDGGPKSIYQTAVCTDDVFTDFVLSPYRWVVGGNYSWSAHLRDKSAVSDDQNGGSYPKGWKVCKVNDFADPC